MKILIRDKDLLAVLPAANVHKYLKSRGWEDNGPWGRQKLGVLYLKEVGGHEWGFGFPYSDTVPDYVSCMAHAIETLGKVEERSELEVFYDILNEGPDVAKGQGLPALQEFAEILKAGVDATRAHAGTKSS